MKFKNEYLRMSGKVKFEANSLELISSQAEIIRSQLVPPILPGMKRVEVDFNISSDGTELEWKTLDVDVDDITPRKRGMSIGD